MSARVHQFESRFTQFCDLLKQFKISNTQHIDTLFSEYTVLYNSGMRISDKELAHLPSNHTFIRHILGIGKEHFYTLCQPVAQLIATHPQSFAEHIHTLFDAPAPALLLDDVRARQRLQAVLGDNAKIAVLKTMVENNNSTQIGRTVAYGLSGMAQQDLMLHKTSKVLSAKVIKYRNQSEAEFLIDRVGQYETHLLYDVAKKGTPLAASLITDVPFREHTLFTSSIKRVSDAVFVNHNQQFVGIVVPNSTQATLLETHQAIDLLVRQDTLKDSSNDIYTYAYHLCFCPPPGHSSAALLHTPFAKIMARTNGPLHQALKNCSIYIIGSDTLSIQNTINAAIETDQRDPQERALAHLFLEHIASALNKKDTSNEWRDTLLGLKNYFVAFPLQTHCITEAERTMFEHIQHELNGISAEPLQVFSAHLNTIDNLVREAKEFCAQALFQAPNADVAPQQIAFSQKRYSALLSHTAQTVEIEHKKNMLTAFILDSMSQNQAPLCVQEFISLARSSIEQHSIPNPQKAQEFFTDVHQMFLGKVGADVPTEKGQTTFRRWLNTVAATNLDNPTPASVAVLACAGLFGTGLWHDRDNLPFNTRMKAVVDKMALTILEFARMSSGSTLHNLLEEALHTPKRRLK